jgi:tryptophanyl-tRNA synthetase
MHALTSGSGDANAPQALQEEVVSMATGLLACGLDASNSTLFVQSQVSAHAELAWLLQCVTPLPWLNMMTQFKDKKETNKAGVNVGLYTYPVLQAADVLLYDATKIPVGHDQAQHIELVRKIAKTFNEKTASNCFVLPQAVITTEANTQRVMSLRDGTSKMSKSAPSAQSRIDLTDTPEVIVKKINKAKTDAHEGFSLDADHRPEITNLLNIYAAMHGVTPTEALQTATVQAWSKRQFKTDLADKLIEHLRPLQAEYTRLKNDRSYVESVLLQGKETATELAERKLTHVKQVLRMHS